MSRHALSDFFYSRCTATTCALAAESVRCGCDDPSDSQNVVLHPQFDMYLPAGELLRTVTWNKHVKLLVLTPQVLGNNLSMWDDHVQ